MMNAFRYAAILVWGSVVLLGPNVQTVRADGGHGGMMCGHMCEGHDQSKQDEHSSYDLKHLLKHGKEIGLTSEQISKLKTMQLDLGRAQARAEADIKVATLELHALVEDEQADLGSDSGQGGPTQEGGRRSFVHGDQVEARRDGDIDSGTARESSRNAGQDDGDDEGGRGSAYRWDEWNERDARWRAWEKWRTWERGGSRASTLGHQPGGSGVLHHPEAKC